MRDKQFGKIKFFNQKKAWGFIEKDGGGDMFVHITGLACEPEELQEGTRVSFYEGSGRRGAKAVGVKVGD